MIPRSRRWLHASVTAGALLADAAAGHAAPPTEGAGSAESTSPAFRRAQVGPLLGIGTASTETTRLDERRTTVNDSTGLQAVHLHGHYALLSWLALGGRVGLLNLASPLGQFYYDPPALGRAVDLSALVLFLPPARGSWQFYGGLLGGASVFPGHHDELATTEVESSVWVAPHWGMLAGVRLGMTERFSLLVEGRSIRYRIARTREMRTTAEAPVAQPLSATETDRFLADTLALALGVAWSL